MYLQRAILTNSLENLAELLSKLRLFYAPKNKKGRDKMITRIFGTVTGGRLNLRVAADSSASILASIPNETLLVVTEHDVA